MYRHISASEHRAYLKLPDDYKVDGFLIYGTFRTFPYDMLADALRSLGAPYQLRRLDQHEFLAPIAEFVVNNRRFWFTTAYGGALLSEYLHLACLFGSKKNILVGSCGGLKKGAKSLEIVVPDWSFGEESSAKLYQPDAGHKYEASQPLSTQLAAILSEKYRVHRGPTVTCQAMLGETWDDVIRWAEQGYVAVEMEAATVFAVSNHFGVDCAAMLRIGDNLIEEETVMDLNYEKSVDLRKQMSQAIMDRVLAKLIEE